MHYSCCPSTKLGPLCWVQGTKGHEYKKNYKKSYKQEKWIETIEKVRNYIQKFPLATWTVGLDSLYKGLYSRGASTCGRFEGMSLFSSERIDDFKKSRSKY
ncbi:hypothetical protein AVEN_221809-1 [Araneus ventricosus]|uniref:Uncharacterized protein n=1 Tax=Araneus ventricosus TaxID=182803 RepID=A0A4Y2KMH8_ARAVE|nr:hypothetical protein AVEN_270390-1 [Araneus ventricosus]GBN03491.1 hypothetical protein AVEN_75914-1 [Araneus ventricosus]GBN03535.1 hypothetical protein AVEN_129552-1 [Araneus ventricosus]GBN03640.1 hypothetical protein AVEN_221809-1 [Araneus ventricosus]